MNKLRKWPTSIIHETKNSVETLRRVRKTIIVGFTSVCMNRFSEFCVCVCPRCMCHKLKCIRALDCPPLQKEEHNQKCKVSKTSSVLKQTCLQGTHTIAWAHTIDGRRTGNSILGPLPLRVFHRKSLQLLYPFVTTWAMGEMERPSYFISAVAGCLIFYVASLSL